MNKKITKEDIYLFLEQNNITIYDANGREDFLIEESENGFEILVG